MKVRNQIYGLVYEINMNPGPVIIFSRPLALEEADFISIQKKMIQSIAIPRLLALQFTEIDLQITMRFKLESKKTLSQFIQNKKLHETDCYRLLYAITSIIEDSKNYLLSEDRYLLQEQLIYIGTDYTDVHLIYLPLKALQHKSNVQVEMHQLASNLFRKTEQPLSISGQKLLQQMNASTLQMNDLKELFLQCIADAEPLQMEEIQELPMVLPQKPNSLIKRLLKLSMPSNLSFNNPFLMITCLSILLLTWLMFILYPSVGAFNLCLGITMFAVNATYWLNVSIGKMETSDLSSLNIFEKQKYGLSMVNASEYYENLSEQTNLLIPNDATVLLPKQVHAFLEMNQGTTSEKINLNADPFVIGRNADIVQYAVNWVGISRMHLEIAREGMEYSVKDLGSKNGSFLNEEQMIPHKSYMLTEGDRIKIVEKEFLYKKTI
ncbi:MAG: hypothetical protein JWM44_1162 [Bacilli bacterium]|nr:hypothetical protein [Bacilli bacterium]